MKAHDLREMTPQELQHSLDELFQEQFNLRFQAATKQLQNLSRMRQVRRDIARINTVLRELELRAEVL
jgi:large subunit ribosomal protein L29